MKKNIPIISQLLKAIIIEDYAEAINIITDEEFDPNERNQSWNSPVLSAIITVISGNTKIKDLTSLKTVLKEIAKNDKFDPNARDSEGETVLMHIAMHSEFNWLAPFILSHKGVDLSIRNVMNQDVIDLAERYKNNVLMDVLLTFKGTTGVHDGLPKRKIGVKKIAKVTVTEVKETKEDKGNILNKLEFAFYPEAKTRPTSLYNLMTSFFKGEFDTCIQILKDPNFNPNECDKWDEPALTSFIYYTQEAGAKYDEERFKEIADLIIKNPRFDVNALDADCNTVLMACMGFPRLKWLTEKLFNISSARLDVLNDMGDDIREIAKSCGCEEFYNNLCRKSFETATVVE